MFLTEALKQRIHVSGYGELRVGLSKKYENQAQFFGILEQLKVETKDQHQCLSKFKYSSESEFFRSTLNEWNPGCDYGEKWIWG